MVNQLGKFLPRLAEKTEPLRALITSKLEWLWGNSQQRAFETIREDLFQPQVLALYSPTRLTAVSSDASAYGLGVVIRQKQNNGEWKPIAYASRSLTSAEARYAQIEKEALSITWACDRFCNYLLGMLFHVEMDHKPLVSLLSTSRCLEELPLRVQRLRL